jgi:molybdopterin converting factor small subunit
MNYYRQSIILFGIVVPFLICAIAIGGCIYAIGDFQQTLKTKQAEFKTNSTLQKTIKELEKEVGAERPYLERWTEDLSKETASSVSNNLRRITSKLPPKEIIQTAFEPSATKGGFGSASAQKSSIVKVGFRGTYRTIQRALLELESIMPQLHIVDMKMDPISGENSMINMQVTYTVWEN